MVENRFDRVLRGPLILERSIEAFEANPMTGIAVAVLGVAEREKYVLSPKQMRTLQNMSPFVDKHAEGARKAKIYQSERPAKLNKRLSQQLGIPEEGIKKVIVYPTALHVGLDSYQFSKLWNKENEKEELVTGGLPLGFASDTGTVTLSGVKFPVTFENANINSTTTADHEYQHAQHRYIHGTYSNEPTLPRKKIYDNHRAYGFTISMLEDVGKLQRTIRKGAGGYIELFLDELASRSLSGRSVYDDYFSRGSGAYSISFEREIEAYRDGLPTDMHKRRKWDEALWTEELRMRHQMQYVERVYEKLKGTYQQKRTTSIVQTLTANHAYMIKAFIPSTEVTLDQVMKWAREYRSPTTGTDITSLRTRQAELSGFILFWTRIATTDYAEIRKARARGNTDKFKERITLMVADAQKNGETADFAAIVDERVDVAKAALQPALVDRVAKISTAFQSDYLDKKNLTDEDKKEIKSRVVASAVDFHAEFYRFVLSHTRHLNGIHSPKQMEMFMQNPGLLSRFGSQTKDLVVRFGLHALMMDDKADRVAAELARKGTVSGSDLDLSTPAKVTDKHRQTVLTVLESEKPLPHFKNKYISPLTYESLLYTKLLEGLSGFPDKVRGKDIDPTLARNQVFSILFRTLLWAREKGLPPDRTAKTKEALDSLIKGEAHAVHRALYYHLFPREEASPLTE